MLENDPMSSEFVDEKPTEFEGYLDSCSIEQMINIQKQIIQQNSILTYALNHFNQQPIDEYTLITKDLPLDDPVVNRINRIVSPGVRYVLQCYGRKAGTIFTDLSSSIKYGKVFLLDGFQQLVINGEYITLKDQNNDLFFRVTDNIPRVPKNNTRISIGNGRFTIKPKKYTCILLWVFWDCYPHPIKMDQEIPQSLIENERRVSAMGLTMAEYSKLVLDGVDVETTPIAEGSV